MSALLRSPKGKIGAIAAGGLLVVLALWFLRRLAAAREGDRARAADRASTQAQLSQRKARPRARRRPTSRCKPSDLYRLTKALPDDTNMSGHPARRQPDRGRERADVHARSRRPAGARNRVPAAAARRRRAGSLQQHLELPRRSPHARLRPRQAARCPRPALLGVERRHRGARQPGQVPGRQGRR